MKHKVYYKVVELLVLGDNFLLILNWKTQVIVFL